MTDDPTWPTLMDDKTAAAYLRLGRGSLRTLLAREGVAPVPLGLRLRRWRRADLDALVLRLPVSTAGAPDPARLALAAVERRLAGRPPGGRP